MKNAFDTGEIEVDFERKVFSLSSPLFKQFLPFPTFPTFVALLLAQLSIRGTRKIVCDEEGVFLREDIPFDHAARPTLRERMVAFTVCAQRSRKVFSSLVVFQLRKEADKLFDCE